MKTNMNPRERRRFAEILRQIAKSANEAAVALDMADDDKFITEFIVLSLTGGSLKEIQEVLLDALKEMKEQKDQSEFADRLEVKP